jgi:ketosteroid isomerase-like protein
MILSKRHLAYFVLFVLLIASCWRRHESGEIESALKGYDRLIQKMDADSIALLYTTDGDLGGIAQGRDSIRKFLSGFKNVRVLSVSSTSEKIELNADTAIQLGRFNQVALVNGTDTLRPKGTFTAKWIWTKEEGWKIRSMNTKPDTQ